jgi:hypothetical protein
VLLFYQSTARVPLLCCRFAVPVQQLRLEFDELVEDILFDDGLLQGVQ